MGNLNREKAKIFSHLQTAIELELSTIPPYLVAMYSIKPATNPEAYRIIRSVLMEEMLHVVLAANTLSAIGGSVKLGKKNIQRYPVNMNFQGKFKNRPVTVNLEKLGPLAIQTFLQIELPDFLADTGKRAFTVEGYTVGEFYQMIKADLERLCNDHGEENIFKNNSMQVSTQYYWGAGGEAIVVHNLKTAHQALDGIIDQGEGIVDLRMNKDLFMSEADTPHYFRFKEIEMGRYFRPGDKIDQPTGRTLSVDFGDVYPLKTNCIEEDFKHQPELIHLNNLFNFNYTKMLTQLQEGFSGNPHVFYSAIINCMRNLTTIAKDMVQIKLINDPDGQHAAPIFAWYSGKQL